MSPENPSDPFQYASEPTTGQTVKWVKVTIIFLIVIILIAAAIYAVMWLSNSIKEKNANINTEMNPDNGSNPVIANETNNATNNTGNNATNTTNNTAGNTTGNQTGLYDCSGDIYNCANFTTQAQAQAVYNYCISQGKGDINGLDADSNGIACEGL